MWDTLKRIIYADYEKILKAPQITRKVSGEWSGRMEKCGQESWSWTCIIIFVEFLKD